MKTMLLSLVSLTIALVSTAECGAVSATMAPSAAPANAQASLARTGVHDPHRLGWSITATITVDTTSPVHSARCTTR